MVLNAQEHHPFRISLSHGIIELTRLDQLISVEEILSMADKEMYKEKAVRHSQDLNILR